jgi:hypothetical protein
MSDERPDDDKIRLELDIYGTKVKTAVTPAGTDEPTPKDWGDVGRQLNQYLMLIVRDLLGFVSDVVTSSRRIIRGLSRMPEAVANRIDEAHEMADAREAWAQEAAVAHDLASAVEKVQNKLAELHARGIPVQLVQRDDGRIVLLLTGPEEQPEAEEIAKTAFEGSPEQQIGLSGPPAGVSLPPYSGPTTGMREPRK